MEHEHLLIYVEILSISNSKTGKAKPALSISLSIHYDSVFSTAQTHITQYDVLEVNISNFLGQRFIFKSFQEEAIMNFDKK